ncbi:MULTISPECIES: hypothetical protein [Lysinibacillus]|uniref:Uncharacterized protein n=1 Tax=Lysinibacillus xylanilyticus TaxID=582475 RepID=A0ABV3W507_9BACI
MRNNIGQSETFKNAITELDELSADGFFGKDVKHLMKKRDNTEITEFLFEILNNWCEDDNQFQKDNVKDLMAVFLEMFIEVFKIGKQEAIDVITAFFIGTRDNPELEFMSAYTEFAFSYTNFKTMVHEIDSSKLADRKRYANVISNTYSKGVEFIGKTLVTCIILKKIIAGKSYNYYGVYNLTLAKKLEALTSDKNADHKKLVSIINRNLRNSEAHLSLTFNHITNEYILKKTAKGKIKTEKISAEKMIVELLIGVGNYAQAFLYAGVLFTLAHEDKELFIKIMQKIYN